MNKIFKIFSILILNFFLISQTSFSEESKIKIGLLVPLSGNNSELGQQIIKATRMALKEINADQIEIYPKDTASDPIITLRSAKEFEQMGFAYQSIPHNKTLARLKSGDGRGKSFASLPIAVAIPLRSSGVERSCPSLARKI